MELITQIILLIIGFLFLIKGADLFVEGSGNIASILKIPTIIIGLTIVAFGTSAPEAAVSATASLTGNNAIAVSNVIGSNIFNILVVIGACALFKDVGVERKLVEKDLPFLVIINVLLIVLIIIEWNIARIEGLILLILIIAYVSYLVLNAKKSKQAQYIEKPKLSLAKSIFYIFVGLVGIILGGDFVVNSAKYIASTFGMSDTLIGLTIVAIGTSLPELVTSLTALRKGDTGIVVGNVIGSNIFNILFILGLSSLISPIILNSTMLIDLILMLAITVLCYIFGKTNHKFDRKEGITLLIVFILYMTFAIMRN